MKRFAPREWKAIPRFTLLRRNMVAIADSSRGTEARQDFGRKKGLLRSAKSSQTVESLSHGHCRGLEERLLERMLKGRTQDLRWAVGSDGHIVFAADAEFSGNVN